MSSNDIQWKDFPFLKLSNEQLQAHSKEWAFVVLYFAPSDSHSTLEEYQIKRMQRTIECTRLIETTVPVASIQNDGLFLTFLFERSEDALAAALILIQQHQHDFHIGAGSGLGYNFDHFKCLDLLQLKGALPFGNTVEVQISAKLKEETEIPHGIGAFQCSPALAQRTGMNYWILKDYRSSLE